MIFVAVTNRSLYVNHTCGIMSICEICYKNDTSTGCGKCNINVCSVCKVGEDPVWLCKACSIQCNKCGKYGSDSIDTAHRSDGIGRCVECSDTFCLDDCMKSCVKCNARMCKPCVGKMNTGRMDAVCSNCV